MIKILMFLIFSTIIFGENFLISTNGKISISFDTQLLRVDYIKEEVCDQEKDIRRIKLGVIIDGKIYHLDEHIQSVKYINGTNIIKIDSKVENEKIVTYIFVPKLAQSDKVVFLNEIDSNIENIQFYYYIETKNSSGRITKVDKNRSIERDVYFDTPYNESDLYITTEADFQELKIKLIKDSIRKNMDDRLFIVSDFNKEEKRLRNMFMISFNEETQITRNVLNNEISYWNHQDISGNIKIENKSRKEQEVLRQSLSLLSSSQMENGAIPQKIGESSDIRVENILYSILAFINTNNSSFAKKGFEFILSGNTGVLADKIGSEYLVANYKYDCSGNELIEVEEEGEVVSYYNKGLFLYVLSEYMRNFSDFSFLSNEFERIDRLVSDVLISKVEEGNLQDCLTGIVGWNNRKDYLLTYYFVHKGLQNFVEQLENVNVDIALEKYYNALEKIENKIDFELNENQMIGDTLDRANCSLISIQALDPDFIKNKEMIKNSIEFLYDEFGNSEGTGFQNNTETNIDDMLLSMRAVKILYKNGENEKARLIRNSITEAAYENLDIIPNIIIKIENEIKYGSTGINTIHLATYINMIAVGEKYGD